MMKMLPVCLSLLVLACAGCATQSGTSAMGAGPAAKASNERTLYCKDGAYVTKSMGCAAGLERDMTPAPAASK
jgi:hypothetical protein